MNGVLACWVREKKGVLGLKPPDGLEVNHKGKDPNKGNSEDKGERGKG